MDVHQIISLFCTAWVLCLMEVEVVICCLLRAQSMQTYKLGTDIHSCIADEAIKRNSVLCCWETFSHSIPLPKNSAALNY